MKRNIICILVLGVLLVGCSSNNKVTVIDEHIKASTEESIAENTEVATESIKKESVNEQDTNNTYDYIDKKDNYYGKAIDRTNTVITNKNEAIDYVNSHKDMYGLHSDKSKIVLLDERKLDSGFNYYFTQYYDDVEVYASGLIIDLDTSGNITFVNNSLVSDSNFDSLDKSKIKPVKEVLSSYPYSEDAVELIIMNGRYAYTFMELCDKEDYVTVDAITGEEINREPSIMY